MASMNKDFWIHYIPFLSVYRWLASNIGPFESYLPLCLTISEIRMASQIERRLSHIEYSDKICIEAIRGERLPEALGLPVVQHSVIRGIRYHDGFAEELMGSLPAFTRALCARSIMSNRVLPKSQKKNDYIVLLQDEDRLAQPIYPRGPQHFVFPYN